MNHRKMLKQTYHQLKQQAGKKFYQLNDKPINPFDIIKNLYLRPMLTEKEQQLLYLKRHSEYDITEQELANALNMPLDMVRNIEKRINTFLSTDQTYPKFESYMLKKYNKAILDIDVFQDSKNYVEEYMLSAELSSESAVRKKEIV